METALWIVLKAALTVASIVMGAGALIVVIMIIGYLQVKRRLQSDPDYDSDYDLSDW